MRVAAFVRLAPLAALAFAASVAPACSSEAPQQGLESATIGVAKQAATASFVLFPTGVDASGALLAASAADPHYTLSLSTDPRYPSGNGALVDPNTKLGGGWNPAGATSQWVSPSGDSCAATCSVATYEYTTSFTIPSGGTVSTATISGQLNADDSVTVLLNGAIIGVPILNAWAAPARAFTIPAGSGFRAGANTLTFRVQNAGGAASGLDVRQIAGTFTSACVVDADCSGTANTYCDGRTLTCVARLPNGTAIPVDGTHLGLCTAGVGAAVCASGICNTAANTCGLPLGGACTATAQCTVGVCVTTGANAGTCRACATDANCSGATPACDGTTNACVACTATNATACTAGTPVCDTTAHACVACARDFGLSGAAACPSGARPYCAASGACGSCASNADCGGAHAGAICNTASGACGASCGTDADCPIGFCDNPTAAAFGGTCSPKLSNGTKVPSDAPTLGRCTTAVGTRVCVSGACDTSDDSCGLVNGGGCASAVVCRSGVCGVGGLCGRGNGEACTPATVAACRSLVCDDDGACGRPDGKGPCTVDAQCRSQPCDTASQRCGCSDDSACTASEFCRASTRACTPRGGTGASCTRNVECTSGTCTAGTCAAAGTTDGGSGDAGAGADASAEAGGNDGSTPDAGSTEDDGGESVDAGGDGSADGSTHLGDAAGGSDGGRHDASAGLDASPDDTGSIGGGGCSLRRGSDTPEAPAGALTVAAVALVTLVRRRRKG